MTIVVLLLSLAFGCYGLDLCSNIDFRPIKELGSGTYGVVWLVESITGAQYAMKIPAEEGRKDLLKEMNVYDTLNHPNIVKPVCGSKSRTQTFMIMKLFANGDCGDTHFPDRSLARVSAQLIGAVYHLHLAGYIHFDIKPQNLLYDGRNVALADMGLVQKKDRIIDILGSYFTAAPEVKKCMAKRRYGCDRSTVNVSADWYSVGATMFVLAMKDEIDHKKLIQIIEDREYPSYFSRKLKDVLDKLLQVNPAVRMFNTDFAIKRLLAMPFFEGISLNDIIIHPAKQALAPINLKPSNRIRQPFKVVTKNAKLIKDDSIPDLQPIFKPEKIQEERKILVQPLQSIGNGNYISKVSTPVDVDDPMEIDEEPINQLEKYRPPQNPLEKYQHLLEHNKSKSTLSPNALPSIINFDLIDKLVEKNRHIAELKEHLRKIDEQLRILAVQNT